MCGARCRITFHFSTWILGPDTTTKATVKPTTNAAKSTTIAVATTTTKETVDTETTKDQDTDPTEKTTAASTDAGQTSSRSVVTAPPAVTTIKANTPSTVEVESTSPSTTAEPTTSTTTALVVVNDCKEEADETRCNPPPGRNLCGPGFCFVGTCFATECPPPVSKCGTNSAGKPCVTSSCMMGRCFGTAKMFCSPIWPRQFAAGKACVSADNFGIEGFCSTSSGDCEVPFDTLVTPGNGGGEIDQDGKGEVSSTGKNTILTTTASRAPTIITAVRPNTNAPTKLTTTSTHPTQFTPDSQLAYSTYSIQGELELKGVTYTAVLSSPTIQLALYDTIWAVASPNIFGDAGLKLRVHLAHASPGQSEESPTGPTSVVHYVVAKFPDPRMTTANLHQEHQALVRTLDNDARMRSEASSDLRLAGITVISAGVLPSPYITAPPRPTIARTVAAAIPSQAASQTVPPTNNSVGAEIGESDDSGPDDLAIAMAVIFVLIIFALTVAFVVMGRWGWLGDRAQGVLKGDVFSPASTLSGESSDYDTGVLSRGLTKIIIRLSEQTFNPQTSPLFCLMATSELVLYFYAPLLMHSRCVGRRHCSKSDI